MLKIKYLLISVFLLNIEATFSMEEVKIEINEKTKLLDSKPKSLAVSQDKDLNKISLGDFIKLLPKEIWQEIISYLKYEDSRKAFLHFLAPIFGVDDLTAKKIAIDIYRLALLNSKGLKKYQNIINNVVKYWKNQDNRKLVNNYLQILNKNFRSGYGEVAIWDHNIDNLSKEEIVLRVLDFKRKKLLEYEGVYNFNKYKFRLASLEIEPYDREYHTCRICSISLLSLIALSLNTAFIIFAFMHPDNMLLLDLAGISFIPWFAIMYFSYLLVNGLRSDISYKLRFESTVFKEINRDNKEFLKKKNLVLADLDNYFLKLLGHDNRVEDITDLNFV